MFNFYSNDLEIVLTICLVSIFTIIIYDFIKFHGKLYLNILKMKVHIINKNNWNEEKEISNDTKFIELDFTLQVINNKNNYNSIYNLSVWKKKKFKKEFIENHNLNLTNTMKSISGTTSYEKLKYINLFPFEVKEFKLKIRLTKEEYENIKKSPIYIKYKTKNKTKKIKLKKYLKSDKKK